MCKEVWVKESNAPDAKTFYFPCGRWLDAGQEDGKIEREILPGEPPKDSRMYIYIYLHLLHIYSVKIYYTIFNGTVQSTKYLALHILRDALKKK